MSLSPAEGKIAAALLERAANTFTHHGANEFNLVREAKLTPEESFEVRIALRAENNDPLEPQPRPDDHISEDWRLMRWLARRLKTHSTHCTVCGGEYAHWEKYDAESEDSPDPEQCGILHGGEHAYTEESFAARYENERAAHVTTSINYADALFKLETAAKDQIQAEQVWKEERDAVIAAKCKYMECLLELWQTQRDVKALQTELDTALFKLHHVGEEYSLEIEARKALAAKLRIVEIHGDNVWRWQGVGDHAETLSCPVVMSADTLREFVAAKEELAALKDRDYERRVERDERD